MSCTEKQLGRSGEGSPSLQCSKDQQAWKQATKGRGENHLKEKEINPKGYHWSAHRLGCFPETRAEKH